MGRHASARRELHRTTGATPQVQRRVARNTPMTQVGPIVLRDVTPRAPIFTTATAAAAADVSPDTASRGLARLQEQGLVTRLVRGLWADTRHPDFSPYAVVPFLLARSPSQEGQPSAGYVSFLSALHLHGILSQIPPAIQVAVA